jgi:hypothetical protein
MTSLSNIKEDYCQVCLRSTRSLTVKFITKATKQGSLTVCYQCRDKYIKYIRAGDHDKSEKSLQDFVTDMDYASDSISIHNIHGDHMQKSGLPDVMGVVNGRPIAFELKRFPNYLSSLQKHTLQSFRQAGGESFVIFTEDQAADIVKECIS